MRARTQTFKGCQPHGSPFGLLLVLAGASLLLTALAPRAYAEVDADASRTGANSSIWSLPGNWTAGGPPNALQIASFDRAFANQPTITADTAVGELHMATGVAQDVTILATGVNILTIEGVGIGTAILIDNASAFTLTIAARVGVDASQIWTNNSGNLFTVRGATLSLGENNTLTVNGSGNTLISAVTDGAGGTGSAILRTVAAR